MAPVPSETRRTTGSLSQRLVLPSRPVKPGGRHREGEDGIWMGEITRVHEETAQARPDVVEAATAIRARGLVKTYESSAGVVEAVRGVDLDVSADAVFGFLGPNGAGKSTIVRMLTTLMTIPQGSAMVAGIDVAADPDGARQKIGVALQEAGLDPRQTGRELLVLQGRLFGFSAAVAAERAQELLALVELEGAADR